MDGDSGGSLSSVSVSELHLIHTILPCPDAGIDSLPAVREGRKSKPSEVPASVG